MIRRVSIILLSLLAVILSFSVTLAYLFTAPVTIAESTGVAYPMIGLWDTLPTAWLVAHGYIDADARDTAIVTDRPHLVTDTRLWVATPLPANGQVNVNFTTGNTPLASMDIVTGYGGFITTLEANALRLGNKFSIEQKGWVDTFTYSTGTVTVTNADATVEGAGGTVWTSAMAGYNFVSADGLNYYVLSVTDADTLELTTVYAGGTLGGQTYRIGANKDLVLKTGSIRTYVSALNTITSAITDTKLIYYDAGDDGNVPVGDDWGANDYDAAQSFTTVNSFLVSSVSVKCNISGGASNNSTVSIRLMGVAPDSNAALTTGVATMHVNGWVTFDVADITLAAATQYVIVFVDTDGDDQWREDGSGATYADGTSWTQFNAGGWVEDADDDFMFRVNTAPTISITPVPSVGYTVKTYCDGTWFMLSLDGDVTWDGVHSNRVASGGVIVAITVTDWIIAQNNVMPYMNYYSHSVDVGAGLVLIAHYHPEAIVVQATGLLPDLEAPAQNGTITWGTSPAGTAMAIGSLSGYGGSFADTTEDVVLDRLPEVPVSDWYGDNTVTKASTLNNPFRPFVQMVSDNPEGYPNHMTEIQVWRWFGAIILIGAAAGIGKLARGHQGITAIATGAVIALLIAFDSSIFPLYLAVLSVGLMIGGLLSERSHSL